MLRIKYLLIFFGILLIIIDRFSFINSLRDSVNIFLQKELSLFVYRIQYYSQAIFLQYSEKNILQRQIIELQQKLEQCEINNLQNMRNATDAKEALEIRHIIKQKALQVVLSRVIVDKNYLINGKILINKGKNDKISIGNAVINKDGLVGRIIQVNDSSAQVQLITSADYKIYLQNTSNKTKLLAQGEGGNSNMMKIDYIAKSDHIQVGDILTTTGLDDVYPADIPVAKISSILSYNSINSALCKPLIDFNQLNIVSVILS